MSKGDVVHAQASETISVYMAMELFCEMVLKPNNLLLEHVDCLMTGGEILHIFLLGDRAVEFKPRLRCLGVKLNALVVKLYGIAKMRIKNHTYFHCLDKLGEKGANINTLAGERKNKFPKELFRHTDCENSVLHRMLIQWLEGVKEGSCLQDLRVFC